MSDFLINNKFIYNLELNIVNTFSWITKIIIFLYIIGFFKEKPLQFETINFTFKVIIALFLIYRFNSYRKKTIHFTELDRKIAYSSGIYILLISFVDIFDSYTQKFRSIIVPYTKPIINEIHPYIDNNIFSIMKEEKPNTIEFHQEMQHRILQ